MIDGMPASSAAISPNNYRFHFAGEVETGAGAAYIYDSTPKKKRPGMTAGRLWLGSSDGNEIMLSGNVVTKAAVGHMQVVRETSYINGIAFERVSHISWTMPLPGRAELVISEFRLNAGAAPETGFRRPPALASAPEIARH